MILLVLRARQLQIGPSVISSYVRSIETRSLFEIVAGAEKLNVFLVDGATTTGIGEDVIEMQAVRCAALHAPSLISLVDRDLDSGWDDSIVIESRIPNHG